MRAAGFLVMAASTSRPPARCSNCAVVSAIRRRDWKTPAGTSIGSTGGKRSVPDARSATKEQSMTNRIGWIGLGRMGEAMVKRLLQAGIGVSVWNRTRSKAEALAQFDAEVVGSRIELAGCEVVFTMV